MRLTPGLFINQLFQLPLRASSHDALVTSDSLPQGRASSMAEGRQARTPRRITRSYAMQASDAVSLRQSTISAALTSETHLAIATSVSLRMTASLAEGGVSRRG